jgi:hypothetical protein
MWKGLESNTGEREGYERTKRIKEGKKEGEELRYKIKHFPVNFNVLVNSVLIIQRLQDRIDAIYDYLTCLIVREMEHSSCCLCHFTKV